jgi:hypothetical protein
MTTKEPSAGRQGRKWMEVSLSAVRRKESSKVVVDGGKGQEGRQREEKEGERGFLSGLSSRVLGG